VPRWEPYVSQGTSFIPGSGKFITELLEALKAERDTAAAKVTRPRREEFHYAWLWAGDGRGVLIGL